MKEYYDYFPYQEHDPEDPDFTTDEFIFAMMYEGYIFRSEKEELEFLRSARLALKCEALICYEFMKRKFLLSEYKMFRDTGEGPEEVPF